MNCVRQGVKNLGPHIFKSTSVKVRKGSFRVQPVDSTSRGITSQGGIHREFWNKVGGCIVVNTPVNLVQHGI